MQCPQVFSRCAVDKPYLPTGHVCSLLFRPNCSTFTFIFVKCHPIRFGPWVQPAETFLDPDFVIQHILITLRQCIRRAAELPFWEPVSARHYALHSTLFHSPFPNSAEYVLSPFYFIILLFNLFINLHQVLVTARGIFSCGMWNLVCGLTRGQIQAPCTGNAVLATGTPGRSLSPVYS